MWYQVPEVKPKPAESPKPIFPWERERDRPKPTRIFAEDIPPPEPLPPTPTITINSSSLSGPSGTHPFSTVHYDEEEAPQEVVTPGHGSQRVSSPKTADQQWQDFQQTSSNAWDGVPGIETYVRAIMDSQSRRGKPQIVPQASEEISSPIISRKDRRESLILTDFPSAVERPSLPVTPAPVARPTFWGEERDQQGELPQAEGVPDQQDWVCPQCGFSSVNALDFRPSRELSVSSSSASNDVPAARSIPAQSIEVRPIPTQTPAKKETLPTSQPTSLLSMNTSPKTTAETSSSVPDQPHPRSGVSSRGAPLMSLTNPTLFDAHPHAPGFDPPPSSASTVSSVAATLR